MKSNPNPRVHRITRFAAVDLKSLAAVTRNPNYATRLWLRSAGGVRVGDVSTSFTDVLCTDAEHEFLLNAFEMWGSAR